MVVAENLILGITNRPAPTAALLACSCCPGAIESEADKTTVLKGFVALGLMQGQHKGLARGTRIESFGEVGQAVITKRLGYGKGTARPRAHQGLDRMEGSVAEDLADDQSPQQVLSSDLLLDPSVSRALEIARQMQAAARVALEVPRGRSTHRLRCLRLKTSS